MLKSRFEQISSKITTYQSYKNFTDEQFKEAIRSDSSYIGDGNLTSLQHLIAKRARSIGSLEKDRFTWN